MTWRRTEALTTVRQAADDPRAIEGVALPYGVMSGPTDIDGRGTVGREVHYPGAAKASVEHWMGRQDGARMAYRPRHGERPIGTVHMLEDTPEGVAFRAQILESPAGDAYLSEVAAGINGVSVEFGPGAVPPTRKRDGTVVNREIKLHAIAGSDMPAYDGARIALRDMEPEPDPPPEKPAESTNPDPPTGGSLDSKETSVTETKAPEPEPITAVTPETSASPPPEPTPAPEPVASAEPAQRDAATKAVLPMPSAVRDWLERNSAADLFKGAITITRSEAVYGRNSGNFFLRDLMLSRQGDSAAMERQTRHEAHLTDIANQLERAGDVVSAEIPGAYPNEYLPGLLTPRILKGRPMGGFYQRQPITNAQPKIFAKVTTSTTVAVQSAEGTNPAASDLATTAVTATPLLYGAETVISRQVFDGGDPNAEQFVMQDMIEAYAQASETVIKTAVEAGATASGSAITAATPYAGLQANVVAYQAARFKPATGQFVPPALYTVALAQADTTGRPFYTYINPVNAQATIEAGGASGNILGAVEYLSWASTTNVVVTGRPEDYVIFESSIARFSYDAVTGPAGIRLGIWAYLVVGTRLGSIKVTAA
jgi:phage head maturation protease